MTTTEPTHRGPIKPGPTAAARGAPVGAARAPVRGRADRRASARLPSTEDAAALLREQRIDAVLNDSFPASDPPGWTLGHTG